MRPSRILAVASAGGHWVQLSRLAPAFEGGRVHFVTTMKGTDAPLPGAKLTVVADASRTDKLALTLLVLQLTWVILVERPNVVVTTGAAPGLLALHIGKILGARTVWIDSIANVDQISLSGSLASRCADLWLTQWPHLASTHERLQYRGAVL